MKQLVDSLAIFGGAPLFAEPRPIGQLAAPPVDEYLALLKQAFELRWLANGGPMVLGLERRLAEFHDTRHCIAVANAGLGIMMLLRLFAGNRSGEVIMPAFSFRGLPHFARWAGQQPRFCEVSVDTHTLDPRAVSEAIDSNVRAILAVCNCHSPGDIDGLSRVAAAQGIPILFDSVYAQGATYRGQVLGGFGAAEVYSLHATKLLNGFEGGYITTNNDDLAARLRWQREFCLPSIRPAGVAENENILGINAKLNELHAAMALLSLDHFDDIVAGNQQRFEAYAEVCSRLPGLRLVTAPETGERRNYALMIAETTPPWPLSRDQTVAILRAEGAAISPYYSPALHRSNQDSRNLPMPELPVTNALASRFLQLPGGELVSLDDVRAIGRLLEFLVENGTVVASRLLERGIV
ncbi:MAG: aminotransferase class I/II-fold pyridoxal phosphate-dependent enzyme [Planctomycetota bacterium]